MIADTTFFLDLLQERRRGRRGEASALLARHRAQKIRMTIITAGQLAVGFPGSAEAQAWLEGWTIYRLHLGVALEAAAVDRAQIRAGARLGENDNWIAGFCRYYRMPLLSRDRGFDVVPGLRRIRY